MQRIATLIDLESLRLDFHKSKPSPMTKNALPHLAALVHLRQLYLKRVGPSDTDLAFLDSFRQLQLLAWVDMAVSRWEPQVAKLSTLTELQIYDEDDAELEQLGPLPRLTSLRFGGYPAGHEKRLAKAQRFVKLAPWCRITLHGLPGDDNRKEMFIEPTAPPPTVLADPQPPPAKAPFDAQQARAHQEEWAAYLGVPVEFTNGLGMKFRLIPPGEFQMGLGPEFTDAELTRLIGAKEDRDLGRLRVVRPAHLVRITRPFYMQVDEITSGRYRDVVGQLRPLMQQDPNKLLEQHVAWPDAIAFCNKLSEREGKWLAYRIAGAQITPIDDADGYRLPTEAQWEYACRAGTDTLWYFGNDGSADGVTFRKQCAAPNPFGLTGLYGGSNETCWDATDLKPYPAATPGGREDPREDIGTSRIKRGGSGNDSGGASRFAINSFVRTQSFGGPYDPKENGWHGFGRVAFGRTDRSRRGAHVRRASLFACQRTVPLG